MEIYEVNNSQPISLKRTKSIEIDDIDSIKAVNKKYIISESNNQSLKVEDTNKHLFSIIKFDSTDLTVKFHPRIDNLFLLADENNLKIYEISKDKCGCEEKVNVTGHTQPIITAVFSNTDDKIFATYSKDKTIKVWNLEAPFCICNISVNSIITEIKIYKNFIFYYNKAGNSIIQYDYKELEIKKQFNITTKNFIILNEKKLCLFYKDSLYIIENNSKISNYKFEGIYFQSFYDEDLKLLYLFYGNNFYILNLLVMKEIVKGKINGEPKIAYSNIFNEQNICASFILLFRNKLEYYSLNYEEGYKIKINAVSNKKLLSGTNIWLNVVPTISNMDNLRWNMNCGETVSCKEYLKYKEIEKEFKDNYNKSLEEKKEEVEKIFKLKDPLKPLNLDYCQLLKLLIKDNTNNKLIMMYLKYLYNNKKELQLKYKDKFENFQKEYDRYKVLFDDSELRENKFDEKGYSQKQIFMNLLGKINSLEIKDCDNTNIINSNNTNNNINNNDEKINKFRNEIEEKIINLQLFNQPIIITNNELYWQRNCYILYYALKNILKNKNNIKIMKESLKILFERKIFDKEFIINNNVLLTNILILLAIPQPKNFLEFNLNLIETEDKSYKYEKDLENYHFIPLRKNDNKSYYMTYNNLDHILSEPSTKCVKNCVLNIKKEIELEDFEKKNYQGLKDYFNQLINFDKMITFLSKIFTSNVIREAFQYLYPEYFKFPFKNEKDCLDFLKKYYHFVPLKVNGPAGMTEKFSFEIYYILKKEITQFQVHYQMIIINFVKKYYTEVQ